MSKHLLYLTNTQLTATVWDKGVLSPVQVFDNYASGWSKFSAYLENYKDEPVYLLTDLIEEDFQRESIPHVFGSAKKALIDRRLNNFYRDTPYRSWNFQGREKDGRRDDIMLFSALTNAQLLKPWTDALDEKKVDLSGIYSVALLSTLLLKKITDDKEPLLLITHQSSGLRQSFFQNGHLRFSRLSPETAWSAESIAEMTNAEMAKTRQFLISTRLINRDTNVKMLVLASEDIIEHLQTICIDDEFKKHQFINLYEAKRKLGFHKLIDLNFCDPIVLSLLGSERVSSHYATAEQARIHRLAQAKIGLNLMSLLSVSAAIFISADAGIDAYQAMNQTKQAEIETRNALAKYQATVSNMPVTIVNPNDMRVAVELKQMLDKDGPQPRARFYALSAALTLLPQIKLQTLKWDVIEHSEINDPTLPPVQSLTDEALPLNAQLLGVGKKPQEVILLDGEITPFKNDYRKAIDIVNEFILELKKDSRLQVEIVKPPLDVRPEVKLESLSGNDEDLVKPTFSLKLVWK